MRHPCDRQDRMDSVCELACYAWSRVHVLMTGDIAFESSSSTTLWGLLFRQAVLCMLLCSNLVHNYHHHLIEYKLTMTNEFSFPH